MLAASSPNRAEVLAGFFLAGYLGLSVPVLGLGVAAQFVAPKVALLAFAALLLAGALLSAAAPRRALRVAPSAAWLKPPPYGGKAANREGPGRRRADELDMASFVMPAAVRGRRTFSSQAVWLALCGAWLIAVVGRGRRARRVTATRASCWSAW